MKGNERDASVESFPISANGNFSVPAEARSGSDLGRKWEKMASPVLGGIFSRGRESKMEIPVHTNLNRSNQKASIPFRPDIEGLRALAVGLVIAKLPERKDSIGMIGPWTRTLTSVWHCPIERHDRGQHRSSGSAIEIPYRASITPKSQVHAHRLNSTETLAFGNRSWTERLVASH